jgi:hypothetical protein
MGGRIALDRSMTSAGFVLHDGFLSTATSSFQP